jgi:hypothetical protein
MPLTTKLERVGFKTVAALTVTPPTARDPKVPTPVTFSEAIVDAKDIVLLVSSTVTKLASCDNSLLFAMGSDSKFLI